MGRRLVGDEETLALVQSDALESFVEAVERGDSTGLNLLLDSVLVEDELHVPASQREGYAKALLAAHLGVLKERARQANSPALPLGPTVTALLEAYIAERKPASKAEAEVRTAYRRFVEIIGDKLAKDVSKADVRAFRENCFSAPSNRVTSRDGKLSAASVKKILGVCAAVFSYGASQGLLESSPFVGGLSRVMREGSPTARRMPYSHENIKAIFHSDAFSKLSGARRRIPLLGLYTGARLEELVGPRVQDVKEEGGIHFLNFVPTEERRLKNTGSARVVPLHPELLRRDVLAYVASQPSGGRLFPDLQRGPHGKFTGSFSKWWARFTEQRGLSDPTLVFHSLRHSFKDACRAGGISEEVHDALTGHTTGSVSRRYGSGPSLPVLSDAVSRVKF